MRQRKRSPGAMAALLLIALSGLLGACCICWNLFKTVQPRIAPATPPPAPTLTVAFSPEKEALFSQLVEPVSYTHLTLPTIYSV